MESPKYLAIIAYEDVKRIVFTHTNTGEKLNTWLVYDHETPEMIHQEIMEKLSCSQYFIRLDQCKGATLLAGSIEDG